MDITQLPKVLENMSRHLRAKNVAAVASPGNAQQEGLGDLNPHIDVSSLLFRQTLHHHQRRPSKARAQHMVELRVQPSHKQFQACTVVELIQLSSDT